MQQEDDEEAGRTRTPEQWNEILAKKDMESQSRIAAVEAQVEEMILAMKEKDEENKELQRSVEKQQKRVRRAQSSLDDEEAEEHRAYASEVMWHQFQSLLSNNGGIS